MVGFAYCIRQALKNLKEKFKFKVQVQPIPN